MIIRGVDVNDRLVSIVSSIFVQSRERTIQGIHTVSTRLFDV